MIELSTSMTDILRLGFLLLLPLATRLLIAASPARAAQTSSLNVSCDKLRPRSEKVQAPYAKASSKVGTVAIAEGFDGGTLPQKGHLTDGGPYDQVIAAAKAR